MWQVRAVQAEERRKQLTAGETRPQEAAVVRSDFGLKKKRKYILIRTANCRTVSSGEQTPKYTPLCGGLWARWHG